MKETELPDKPSELILLAINDLEKCEKDPNYEINMSHWHLPSSFSGKCYVCLAGSVMSKSLGVEINHYSSPGFFEGGKLSALNDFREGMFLEGFYAIFGFSINVPKIFKELDGTITQGYHQDSELFKQTMREKAQQLKEAGY